MDGLDTPGTSGAKKRLDQLWREFQNQRKEDWSLLPTLLVTVIATTVAVFVLGSFFGPDWLTLPLGVAVGVFFAVKLFSRRVQRNGDSAAGGQPGVLKPSSPVAKKGEARAGGLLVLGAALAVFIVCALIQAACGSNMFSSSYSPSTGVVKTLLVNLTFYPGWLLTGALALFGLKMLVTGEE